MGGSLTDVVMRLGEVRLGSTPATEVHDLVVELAVEVVPDAGGATLALPGRDATTRRTTVVAASEGRLLELECEGHPATEATRRRTQLRAEGDLSRWPMFAEIAGRLGICDVVASPFPLRADVYGCLSVYSMKRSFDQQAAVAIDVLAQRCAGAVANAVAFEELSRVNQQLSEGLRSREVIGLAKGILMRQERCSEADAFRILVRSSQRLNRKVREVAEQVAALAEGTSDLAAGNHG
jgi:transcriptional regulator with GAF, ATPase, and Fis domain